MIMSRDGTKIDVVCFGGEDWWYHNRGHIDFQLMRRFAKNGKVLYVNSIVMQKPKLSQGRRFFAKLLRKTKSIMTGLKKTDAGFWVYSPFSLPVHHLFAARRLNHLLLRIQLWRVRKKLAMKDFIVWVACPAACDIAISMKKARLIYQRTDVYELYPDVPAEVVRRCDLELKAKSDLTVFVNKKLYTSESSQCNKAIYLDHGVDFKKFSTAEKLEEIPADMSSISKPIVGFYGSINGRNTVDTELIAEAAACLPEMSFVLIGKVESDCDDLVRRANVWMLGQKAYEEIPHYGKCFDVAIMPWRQNRWVENCNPVKLKEYLALGKPVVSTPFEQLQGYREVIYEAKTPEAFVESIKKALHEDNPERIAARRAKVLHDSWESKSQLVMRELLI